MFNDQAKHQLKKWKSLIDKSHRPYHPPNEHAQEEKEMILKQYLYYKNGYDNVMRFAL